MVWKKNNISFLFYALLLTVFLIVGKTIYAQEKPLKKENWEELSKEYTYKEVSEIEKAKDLDLPNISMPNFNINPDIIMAIVIGIAVIALVLLILQYMGINIFTKKIDRSQINYDYNLDDLENHIEESDLERYLRLALDKNDYRAAIRIYYLRIIKEMSIQKWITWKKDKTNRQYINELGGRSEQANFRDLTRAFELIWYGELKITADDYYKLDPLFNTFLEKIK